MQKQMRYKPQQQKQSEPSFLSDALADAKEEAKGMVRAIGRQKVRDTLSPHRSYAPTIEHHVAPSQNDANFAAAILAQGEAGSAASADGLDMIPTPDAAESSFLDDIGDMANGMGDSLGGVLDSVSEAADCIAGSACDVVSDVAETAVEVGGAVIENAGEIVGDVVSSVVDSLVD